MKRFKLLVAALGVSLVAMLALAPTAQAQDTPTAIGDPLFVEAAGEATPLAATCLLFDAHSLKEKVARAKEELQSAQSTLNHARYAAALSTSRAVRAHE